MNEREMIAWAKTNCVCWAGLTPEQRGFFERHKKDVGRYFGKGQECESVGRLVMPPMSGHYGIVPRLRPDYEPEPEKPRMGWREYEVKTSKYGFYAVPAKGGRDLSRCIDSPGFGGTQFRLPNGPLTDYVATLVFMTDEGPATPVKVRFWEAI